MNRLLSLLLAMAATVAAAQDSHWNYYLSYQNITDIKPADGRVYVLSSEDLFAFQPEDSTISVLSKGNGLNDVLISRIEWAEEVQKLIVLYANYNIDILDSKGNVSTLSGYQKKVMTENKNVNQISVSGHRAYLATDFGVLCLDLDQDVIANTYNLGQKVSGVAVADGKIFAATAGQNSLLVGRLDKNLSRTANWERWQAPEAMQLYNIGGQLYGTRQEEVWNTRPVYDNVLTDSIVGEEEYMEGIEHMLLRYDTATGATDKALGFVSADNTLRSSLNGGVLTMCGGGWVRTFDGQAQQVAADNPWDLHLLAYDRTHGCFWGDNNWMTLQRFGQDGHRLFADGEGVNAVGPRYNYYFFMKHYKGKLYTSGGGFFNGSWLSVMENRPGCIQVLDHGNWQIYEDNLQKYTGFSGYTDISAIAIDPRDSTHVMASSARTGVYEFKDGQFVQNYSVQNSPLVSAVGTNPNYVVINGLFYDDDANLWIINSRADNRIVRLLNNGQWEVVPVAEYNGVSKYLTFGLRSPFMDSRGIVWFVNDHYEYRGLFWYDTKTGHGGVENRFEDDTKLQFTFGMNSEALHCCTEDLDGNIWICTNFGVLVLSSDEAEGQKSVYNQVKVRRSDDDSRTENFLYSLNVSSMAIDRYNRKWFGTLGNGVYLLSSDNQKVLRHFTADTSNLLSDNVESLAIDQQTGEVFFGTDAGLCSFVEGANDDSGTHVATPTAWPNPAAAQPVSIEGLDAGQQISIIGMDGHLMGSGTATTDGTFLWDATQATPGVYLVTGNGDGGQTVLLCKVVIL